MKILVVFPAWIGDAIMAQSLLKQLKTEQPNSQISVIAPQHIAPLVTLMPEADAVLETKFGHGGMQLKQRWQLAKRLCKRFDRAIILPNSFKSALIPWFARIPVRTGWHGESRLGVLNDRRQGQKNIIRMVDRYRALALKPAEQLPLLHVPELILDNPTRQALLDKYKLNTKKPIIALCPGAAYGPSKRWSEISFAVLADHCVQEGWQVWVFGSKDDHYAALEIQYMLHDQDTPDFRSFVGECSLHDSTYLLSLASQVVSNDSGLMHIAAALKRRIICIYGGSSPIYTPPLTEDTAILSANLECQPCFDRTCRFNHYRCLGDVSPHEVLNLLQEHERKKQIMQYAICVENVS